MYNFNHTKRPWKNINGNIFGGIDCRRHVASCNGYQSNVNTDSIEKENDANARLVESAPDLLSYVLCEQAYSDYMHEKITHEQAVKIMNEYGWDPKKEPLEELRKRAIDKVMGKSE